MPSVSRIIRSLALSAAAVSLVLAITVSSPTSSATLTGVQASEAAAHRHRESHRHEVSAPHHKKSHRKHHESEVRDESETESESESAQLARLVKQIRKLEKEVERVEKQESELAEANQDESVSPDDDSADADSADTLPLAIKPGGSFLFPAGVTRAEEAKLAANSTHSNSNDVDLPGLPFAAKILGDLKAAIEDPKAAWIQFKTQHGRKYSVAEDAKRQAIFKANLAAAHAAQSKAPKSGVKAPHERARFGITKFCDRTAAEMDALKGLVVPSNLKSKVAAIEAESDEASEFDVEEEGEEVESTMAAMSLPSGLPANFDWRTQGAVTPVKNQATCGDCWAFATSEIVESAWYLAGNELLELSPEQLATCSYNVPSAHGPADNGCKGGWPDTALDYVEQYGLELESSIPYTANDFTRQGCAYNANDVKVRIAGYSLSSSDEGELAQNIMKYGPAEVALQASEAWHSYTGGVMTDAYCSSQLSDANHALVITGWETDPSGSISWIVRNQWDTTWGEVGYIRLQFGTNTCGVANHAVQASIATQNVKPVTPKPTPLPSCGDRQPWPLSCSLVNTWGGCHSWWLLHPFCRQTCNRC